MCILVVLVLKFMYFDYKVQGKISRNSEDGASLAFLLLLEIESLVIKF